MVVRVAYGGSSVEEYRADMPAIRQVVFCEPALPDGGAPPLANDAGAGGQGGAGGEAGAPSGGGMGGEATASAGSGGGAELDAGGAALPGLRCELWTQGPATLEVEAREFEPVERTLRVSTSACTVFSCPSQRSIRGNPKARVLPEPVWAWPMTSRPPSSIGIARSWIAVGVHMSMSTSARWLDAQS